MFAECFYPCTMHNDVDFRVIFGAHHQMSGREEQSQNEAYIQASVDIQM